MELAKSTVCKCPVRGCEREAKLVGATVQEFINPVNGEQAAHYIVKCAEHGPKLVTTDLQPLTRQNIPTGRRHPAKGPYLK